MMPYRTRQTGASTIREPDDRGLTTGGRHGPGVLHAPERRPTCVLTLLLVVTFPISISPITGGRL